MARAFCAAASADRLCTEACSWRGGCVAAAGEARVGAESAQRKATDHPFFVGVGVRVLLTYYASPLPARQAA